MRQKLFYSQFRSSSAPGARRTRFSRGFTILEVMIAGFVMALAITTSITAMQRAFIAIDTARNLTISAQIMQSEIERMRLKDWAVINAYATAETELTIDSTFTANAAVANRFRFYRTATDVVAGEMRSIAFRVTWRSYDGIPHSRTFVTYYGRSGLYDYYYNQT